MIRRGTVVRRARKAERQAIERAILRVCRALYFRDEDTITLSPSAQAQIIGLEQARRRVS